MVLVCIPAVVGENQIRRHLGLQLFEYRLDFRSYIGQKAIRKGLQYRPPKLVPRKKRGRTARFLLADPIGAEYHPVKHALGVLAPQFENSPPAADFNIVGMAAKTENL